MWKPILPTRCFLQVLGNEIADGGNVLWLLTKLEKNPIESRGLSRDRILDYHEGKAEHRQTGMLHLLQLQLGELLLCVRGTERWAEPLWSSAAHRRLRVPTEVARLHASIVLGDNILVSPELSEADGDNDLEPADGWHLRGSLKGILR